MTHLITQMPHIIGAIIAFIVVGIGWAIAYFVVVGFGNDKDICL